MSTENKSNTPVEIRDLWQTPKQIFNFWDKQYKFEVDVAASKRNALCERYIDEQSNALEVPFWGIEGQDITNVWCNPPYSDIRPWVEKAAEQQRLGVTTVMLVPADQSVGWFKKATESCSEVAIVTGGRIAFINAATGKPVKGNNKGSMFLIWRAYMCSHHIYYVDRDLMMATP